MKDRWRMLKRAMVSAVILAACVQPVFAGQDEIGIKTRAFADRVFAALADVAAKDVDVDSYREAMAPAARALDGLYGATLVSPDFVIKQVYFPSHFLARGFDLKKVPQLTDFYEMMKRDPQPQVSEPGHGSIVQPRLIAFRYPVIRDGKLVWILSVMIRTEAYLRAVGLDKVKAYEISSRGQVAERKGKVSGNCVTAEAALPSNTWTIRYDP